MTDAIQLRMNARKLGLQAIAAFWSFADQDALNRLWNGYGPDRWGAEARAVMTWFYRHFEEPALIHDFDYTVSDGTIEGWLAADGRLYVNLKIKLNAVYPLWKAWLWPCRAIAFGKIKAAQVALELGGYTAYNDAFKRRTDVR